MMLLLPKSLLLSFLLLFSGLVHATSSVSLQPPQQVIASASENLLAALKDPALSKDIHQIRAFVDKDIFPHVDMVRMSALVLGKHWRKASRPQKSRFITAFKNLLVNTYSSTFTKQFNDWTVEYFPLTLKSNAKKTVVKTEVHQLGKSSAKIDYSMVYRNKQWKIYDIKVEGISLVISNRSTFGQLIKQSGNLESVINKLETKNPS